MQNYKYNKITTEKFNIKGELSDDCRTIKYIDGDKEEREITVEKCFEKFAGQPIDLTLTLKTDEDLSGEFEEEE